LREWKRDEGMDQGAAAGKCRRNYPPVSHRYLVTGARLWNRTRFPYLAVPIDGSQRLDRSR
jgi:hypothetical protein